MKPKWGTWLAILMVVSMILSACAAPQSTGPETEAEATAQPEAEVKTYVVATDAAFPPMEFVDENKEIAGFDIDLLNAIAEEMGFKVEWKNTAWDGIFAGLESGDYDAIMSSVTIREDRAEKYDFTEPYINAGQAIVVLTENTEIQSKDDLVGRKIGAQIGTTGAFAVEEIENAELSEYDTIDLAFLDLVAGKLDAVIVDVPVAADYALVSEQFVGKLKIVGDPITEEYYGALVNKGQNAEFIQLFNEGLAKVRANGKYDEIYAKWISGEGSAKPVAEEGAATSSVAPAPGFPVKIAIIAPLSGDVKTFGESVRNGVLMAFEEAEAAGWEIEPIIEDGRCDAQEAANAANKVVFQDEVHYIIGEVCSSSSIPVSEIAEANQVLMISPTATNPSVTINEDGTDKGYVFRACFLDPFQGEVVANLAMELGAKSAAVLYDVGNDYVKGLAEYFRASFEGMGGTVSVYEAYNKEDTDFSAILGKVAAAAPDVIFLPDYYNKNNLIAAQIQEKGIEAILLGADGWDSPDLQTELFEGGYFSNHYSPADPRPVVQSFVAAYSDKYGSAPDSFATLAYDATKILLQAISEAGVDDAAAVRDAMAAINYEGVSGNITFDEFGDPVKKAAIIKIENGEFVFYKFVAPAGMEEEAPAQSSVAPNPGFPVKLAILAPLTGDVKTFGESTRNGALMAIEEAEAVGWEIEPIIEDSRCDAQEAANAANKVIFEDGVHYIIGEVCSSASIPVSEIAEANGVVQISSASTNPAVTINEDGTDKEYVFRACFLDPFQGEVVANLAIELGAKTAAVLFDVGNDYVKGLAEYFKASFEEKGGTVSVFEAYNKEDTDFSAILGKVATAAPDVIFLPDYYNKNNLIAAQIHEKGIEATLLGADGWDSPDLQTDLFEGGYFSNHYSPADPRPVVQSFVQAYADKYGSKPDTLATLAYDATKIMLQAISEAGVDDPAAVKDAMSALHYEGVSGDITFDEFGDPAKKAAIVKVENGEFVFYKFVAP